MRKTNISVVGSIAFDTLETPKGNQDNILGGSATYFSLAASKFAPVEVIGRNFHENCEFISVETAQTVSSPLYKTI